MDRIRRLWSRLGPSKSALVEVGLLFLPSIPALLWLWPNISGLPEHIIQIVVYVYFFVGALIIGARRWSRDELGVNRRGIWISLAFGAPVIAGRTLVIFGVDWGAPAPVPDLLRMAADLAYYVGIVGVVEEFLFRGLVYRALEDWQGAGRAILISSVAFGLWHIGQGPLNVAATASYGLMLALIRWRAGGIVGVILVHGLIDFFAAQLMPDVYLTGASAIIRQIQIPQPGWIALGIVLIYGVPVWLAVIYFRARSRKRAPVVS